MLMRLQNALGREDLIEQMVLLWGAKYSFSKQDESAKTINLIVAYNSSPRSHTALDISLLIAHQTRLATKAKITVQAVYVLEEYQTNDFFDVLPTNEFATSGSIHEIPPRNLCENSTLTSGTRLLTQTNKFAKAENILWQARCLAEEWQSSFKAHLRFGCVSDELKKVVESEAATLLFLGCNSTKHPLVEKLGSNFPCPVLGIPNAIEY